MLCLFKLVSSRLSPRNGDESRNKGLAVRIGTADSHWYQQRRLDMQPTGNMHITGQCVGIGIVTWLEFLGFDGRWAVVITKFMGH